MHSFLAVIATLIIVLNGFYAALVIGLLLRRKPAPRFLAVAIGVWAIVMGALFLVEFVGPVEWKPFMRHWLYFPMAVEMIWNVLNLELLGLLVIVMAILLLRPRIASQPPGKQEGISRREFLYLASYGAAPAAALGMGLHGALTQDDLRVRPFTVPISGLPPELEGFSIAHVSDLHSGLFVGPERLKIISDATNDLKADLIAITGDIINRGMDEFPDALAAMQRLRAPHGIFLCEGNHDLIPGTGLVAGACAANNLPMLYNASATVTVQGRRLLLGGLPWMRSGFEGRPEIVSNLFPARQEGDVRILMAHHPHLFDIAESVDLVLSGHTHGGQIMLGDEVGFGPLFFRYWSGVYQRSNTTMIVSNGCGDWFPCRIGAPAEIGLLRLTAAKTA